jgi:septal ring factor EnvC (AmiA/AmiB activator)
MLATFKVDSSKMNSFIKHLSTYAAIGLALVANCPAGAADADSAQAKAKLAKVRAEIAALTSRLGSELKDRDSLAARLREADLSITTKRRQLDSLHASEQAAIHQRAELRFEEVRTRQKLDLERAALADEARTAYMIGPQEQIKLLMSQSDPASAGRILAYYGYFARERGVKIEEIRQQALRVQALIAQIEQTTTQLQALEDSARQNLSALQSARAERSAALAAVSDQVRSGSEELARLKREEQAEESLVAELSRVLQDFPVDTKESFAALRGKLPWPVPGRMAARYQDSRGPQQAEGGVRWNGVLIETSRGAKVRALYAGRVLYADWLQGLGLLIIVGHSGNYMTLYGHAEVLYKSVGDWVAPGDVIAALSESNAAPQLYFEIREGRKTVDPKIWLRTTP